MAWYTDYRRPFRCKDQPFDLGGDKIQFCLGPGCRRNNGLDNRPGPATVFKQCEPCRLQCRIISLYCSKKCQRLDWPARHRRFHAALPVQLGDPNGYHRPPHFNNKAIACGPEHEWTHANYMQERKANLDTAINALMQEHGIEYAGHSVLHQVLDSPLHKGESEWSGPVQDAITLNDDDAANQNIMRRCLFLALRRFIRALLRLVYETPDHAAYNSRSIQLQDEEFIGRRLDGNRWRAELTFATALPCDEIGIVIEGSDRGQYLVEFHHSREWLLFRYRSLC
jgi:hypothetical protein